MGGQDKKDLLTIFATVHKIPGKYFIIGLVILGSWQVSKEGNPYALILLILAIFFFILEFLVLFAAINRISSKIIGYFK